ncbi:MAG: hypothetical protein RH860_00990 [Cytophagales bacterium]
MKISDKSVNVELPAKDHHNSRLIQEHLEKKLLFSMAINAERQKNILQTS